MEGPESEENKKSEVHLTSAAAFVEGGIQDACDDACSICLEAFHESDPSTVTSCKHEFHLQCILEWCQRSPQCPMCWQPISFKDPSSQELLEAVEKERNIRLNPPRNATIFHHPALGDFELQHLPVGANDADLEERIIQHLAAAAMGRARHIARREGQRNRSSAQGRPQFLVFSTHPNSPPMGPASPTHGANGEPASAITVATLPQTPATGEESSQSTSVPLVQADHISASGSGSGSTALAADNHGSSYNNRRSPSQSSPSSQDRAGPSEFQSFSESLKSRFNAVSTRYKESISRSTRGWKERWFSRNSSMPNVGSEGRQEVNAGIATVSRMMEGLDTRDNNRNDSNPSQSHLEGGSVAHDSNPSQSHLEGGSVANDSNPSQSHLEGGSVANDSNSSQSHLEGGLVAGSNDQHISDAEGEGASRDCDTKTSFAAGSSSN
ncbi:hypothetical protein QN277_002864 [Acacia crassicarpa]|uniref:RING-type E3 ubiquitin transferase n=1 Tax=Acacia crassicarpa TaxID=499986 RepID=A0AAE1NBS2_9FABA|nr:hypothetical protein QN277_002864 [Acacia crassicarpa]